MKFIQYRHVLVFENRYEFTILIFEFVRMTIIGIIFF
jgi:hypothetical protein